MGFTRKYSPAMDAAIVHAQLEQGMSPAQAVAAAAIGELEHAGKRMPAFTMPESTARDKAGDARRERRTLEIARAGATDALEACAARVVALVHAEISAAETTRSRGKLTPDRVAGIARMVKDSAAMLRAIDAGKSGQRAPKTKSANGDTRTRDTPDFIGDLAANTTD